MAAGVFLPISTPGPKLSGQFLRRASLQPPSRKKFLFLSISSSLPIHPSLSLPLIPSYQNDDFNSIDSVGVSVFYSHPPTFFTPCITLVLNHHAFFSSLPRGKLQLCYIDMQGVFMLRSFDNSSPALPLSLVLPPSESPVLCPGDGTRQRVVRRRLRARSSVLTLVCIALQTTWF